MNSKLTLTIIPIFISFLVIFGSYINNIYAKNQLIILAILIISIYPIIIYIFKSQIPKISYPIMIYFIALSLLFHISLFGSFINGADIQTEYYMANNVLKNSYWSQNIHSNVNSMLSIVMTVPIYSLILNYDTVLIFKIIYPIIFAFVPVLLFLTYKKMFGHEISFLSTVIFMFTPFFFLTMPFHARVQIAELFVVSLIYIFCIKKLSPKETLVGIIMMVGIVTSHYGTAYLFMFLLILVLLARYIPGDRKFFHFYDGMKINLFFSFSILYILVLISWYLYTSGGQPFRTIIDLGNSVYKNIFEDFLNLNSRDILSITMRNEDSLIRSIIKWLNGVVILSIMVGFLSVLFKKHKEANLDRNFFIFSFGGVIILAASLLVPSFSDQLSFERLYQILLIFLAPFSIIGSKIFFRKYEIIISIFLSIFLLFNTGIISEIFHDDSPINVALNKSVPTHTQPFYMQSDVIGSQWLGIYTINDINKDKYFGSNLQGEYIIRAFINGNIFMFNATTYDVCRSGRNYILITNKEIIYDQISSIETGQKFLAKMASFRNSSMSRRLVYINKINDIKDTNVYFCQGQ